MNWNDLLSQGLNFVGTVNPHIVIFLFLLCFIGEGVGLAVPYVLEATWLMAGYQLANGVLKFSDLIILVVVTQAGREAGALVLYFFCRKGSTLLEKCKERFKWNTEAIESPFKFLRKVNLLSPFSVAMGRLLWLRFPLTLILAVKRKLKTLLLGVSLSSLAYDGTYIILGAIVGTTTALKPFNVLLYSLAGLTAIYIIIFAVKCVVSSLNQRRERETEAPKIS